jgi:hypothetical protein
MTNETTTNMVKLTTDEILGAVDSLLVRQKDRILDDLNTADFAMDRIDKSNKTLRHRPGSNLNILEENLAKIQQVMHTVEILRPLWIRSGYGYKLNEVIDRIQHSLNRHSTRWMTEDLARPTRKGLLDRIRPVMDEANEMVLVPNWLLVRGCSWLKDVTPDSVE